jgi:hypothetical protein
MTIHRSLLTAAVSLALAGGCALAGAGLLSFATLASAEPMKVAALTPTP